MLQTISRRHVIGGVFFLLVASAIVLANDNSQRVSALRRKPQATDSSSVELGRQLFFDKTLSASGKLSCASCHDPAHAYAPANGLAVQLGGSAMNQQGARAVPSLRYVLNRTPVWTKTYVDSAAERMLEANESPYGGFGWDGRFNLLHQQAAFPLMAGNEMANADPKDLVQKIARASYAKEFRSHFGENIFNTPQLAYEKALAAIEDFELNDPSFHPYSSRFDAYLDGKAVLNAQEQRGLKLFDDPLRGNCASCHTDKKGADGSHPLLTTFQFEALGVPRNPEIKYNAAAHYSDMGLCGPLRKDMARDTQYCGMFKTPSLRNVASRGAFFHNGRFHTLQDALRFYVQRDTDAQRWYPRGKSGVIKFDDLPPSLRENIDTIDLPLTKHANEAPVWNDQEIDDVIAFLKTLNDADVIPTRPDVATTSSP
ncbi:cytochrome-c peroxidase [Collimonas arenae]|uniref:cytochrome-c peroxidase n=1 Tax=Collimonas arenae TaxID=279058 RepID=UPI00068C091D|nr:cytochrome c peroxidase [Collimonas arenae]